ncbi:MAG: outer membrane beta-barrel protein [Vicingaceae bacterium]|nr:outer membrane beta-barrel protein [Vicingaceae bacterium]
MKNFIKFAAVALIVTAFTTNANAQFNAGIDIALPLGDFSDASSFGIGASVGYDFPLSDQMSVGGQIGYTYFSAKTPDFAPDDFSASYGAIPLLGNFKYYFADNTNGFYAMASAGFTIFRYSQEFTFETIDFVNGSFVTVKEKFDDSGSTTDLTIAPGVGMILNEKIDLSARYMIILTDGSSTTYLNIRAAMFF